LVDGDGCPRMRPEEGRIRVVGAFLSIFKAGASRFAAVTGLWLLLAGQAWAQPTATSTIPREAFPPISQRIDSTMDALSRHDFARADKESAAAGDPLLIKIVKWTEYRQPGSRASFGEISQFMVDNPDWPDSRALRRNAEVGIGLSRPPSEILAWFDKNPPLSGSGRIAQINALETLGRSDDARNSARTAWRETNFTEGEERDFLSRFRKYLTQADHAARLDRLIWDGRIFDARRLLRLVDADTQALANARLALRRLDPGVDGALKRVPASLQNDPGLLYERLRWRRIKGRDYEAREMLEHPPANLVRPELWWDERSVQVRRALANGEASVAYKLASNNGLSRGAAYADAEFLSGWIALRFLGNAADALKHFQALHDNVSFPVSLARGAYWAGRAAEALGDEEAYQTWYGEAVGYPTTFYGQMARVRLEDPSIPVDPPVSVDEAKAFAADELVRAASYVSHSTDRSLLRSFILRLVDRAKTPAEHRLISALADHQGYPEVAVAASKASARKGVILIDNAYPKRSFPAGANSVEPELALAVMRQESAFDIKAVSSAGARGLMQLIGSTAQSVAKALKLPYDRDRLVQDPDYNVRLGTRYLGDLVDQFGGSYVLAVAAYNAGPARVRSWSRSGGDPRKGALDIVDWIEMIPLSETRDYVQRVIENLEVYRARNGGAQIGARLKDDLARGSITPTISPAETP
jgi:soluble lytic murein transglycosylase